MGQLFCCVQVDQSYVVIKETFGKFDGVLEPGCHFVLWCLGSAISGYLSLRVQQQLDVRCETKTKVTTVALGSKILEFRPLKVSVVGLTGLSLQRKWLHLLSKLDLFVSYKIIVCQKICSGSAC